MNNCLGIINLSEIDTNFGVLCQSRPTSMLPFGGRYRIIDFMLSNMVNSGISGIGVFTGNKVRSVMDHLGSGKPWDLDRKLNGLFLFTPTYDYTSTYKRMGDLDLFYQNSNFIKFAKQEHLLLSKSYMLANIDLNDAYWDFVNSGADISLVYKRVTDDSFRYIGCDKIYLNDNGTFKSVGTNLGKEDTFNLSLEMYFMKKEVYFDILFEAIEQGSANFLKQAVFNLLHRYKVHTYQFDGYVACINNVRNYFDANFDILNPEIATELFFKNGQIFTKVKDEPSAYYKDNAHVKNAFVANGCQIDGTVENAILFRGVRVEKGAEIKNAIVMQKSVIRRGVTLNHVILDKRTRVEEGISLMGDHASPFVAGKQSVISKEAL
ncbi:glucose-1-phosphate adenylyltransferase subunit GlgD [Fusibacter paucivorans]|uniref:Glucose-1-phosphate adenylyltransferase subunit GlgD n=1 Tax=Fusibacter paucivorans TaxID=76009 RepID=A0ABS5PRJ7_9FIRM|nr:glucose-1-phosphate adenylyltransferase subunit GlgD [Fusibacter paucivorans]MBS7527788.1 glucose-1-phosphate adenylyltransferase subunit GlgD [Fusibacter paucivorans]